MKRKKIQITLLLLILIGIIIISIYYFFQQKDTTILPSFMQSNSAWAEKEVQKLTEKEKLSQLLFIETDGLIDNFIPGALAFSGNDFGHFEQLKAKLSTQKLQKPIFVNLFADGLCHFSKIQTNLNINHFFANSDSNSTQNLSEYILQLNLSLSQNFHVFSLLNLRPSFEYDSAFYSDLLLKAIKTTQLSDNQKVLNGHWCNFSLENLKKDTVIYQHELKIVKELIKSKIPALFLKNPSNTLVVYLRKNLNFGGLIISDFRDKEIPKTEILVDLIENGNTFFLISKKSEKFIQSFLKLGTKIKKGKLDEQVKIVLLAKKWIEKDKTQFQANLCEDNSYQLQTNKLIENSITLLKNKDKLIPLLSVKETFLVFNIGKNTEAFNSMLRNYIEFTAFDFNKNKKIIKQKVDKLIITLNSETLTNEELKYIEEIINTLKTKQKPILINFGNVKNITHFEGFQTIIQSYGNLPIEQELCAQALMGGIGLKGCLPSYYKEKKLFPSTFTSIKTRLKYAVAEEVNMSTKKLEVIDSIALAEISAGAFPGCQIFVAYKGVIVYNKQFGYHTYSKQDKVKETDLYDLASLTKISATTLAAMKMFDLKKINLTTTLSNCMKNTKIDYTRIIPDTIIRIDTLLLKEIPNLKKLLATTDTINLNDSMIVTFDTIIAKLTPKRNIFKVPLQEMLVHESGIMPVLPILPYILYKLPQKRKSFKIKTSVFQDVNDSLQNEPKYDTIYSEGKKLKRSEAFAKYYSKNKTDSSRLQIAENMYLKNSYRDTLWIETKQLNVAQEKKYQYSDVNMILVQMAIDSLNGENIDEFLKNSFYDELGFKNTCFLPLKEHSKNEIVPTALDKVWRNQLLQGYVHDPSAAILGGIAGNAGLFSTAKEQGILYQMLLNKGTYGGTRYLSSEVVELFTKRQAGHVRGLGFEIQSSKAIMSQYASSTTYGHTGFTGNCVWVDPEKELVFVFISNRVYPDSKNGKINGHKVRQKVHDAVYKAIIP